jgi:AcrR family transcriptional regulator
MASRPPTAAAGPGQGRRRAAHLGPERRRPLVLDAALHLFVKDGYRGTSMDAIATAAGVTKPVLYDCYPSKEELFAALLRREEEQLLSAIASALPQAPAFDDVESLLAEGLGALLEAAQASPDSWRIVFDSEHGADPAVARRVRRARAAIVAGLQELVGAFLETAGVEEIDRKAPVLAELVASIGEGSVRVMLASEGSWTPEELAGLVARVAARGASAA